VRQLQQFAFCFTFNYQLKLHAQTEDRQTKAEQLFGLFSARNQARGESVETGGEPEENRRSSIAIAELGARSPKATAEPDLLQTHRPSVIVIPKTREVVALIKNGIP